MTPRLFFSRRGRQEGGKPGIAGLYGGPQSVFRFCEGSARSLHEPFEFPRLCHLSAVQLCSQQPAENFSNTPNRFHALEMATLAFKPYTYVPTPPRSTSTATRRRPAPKQVSILNKLQQIRSSSTSLSTPRPAAAAAADNDGGYRPGIRGTGTVYGGSNKENDDENEDGRDLPIIEELLFTKLQEQGFAVADPNPGHKERGVKKVATDKRDGSVDQGRSAQSDNSGGSPGEPRPLDPYYKMDGQFF